MEDKSSEMKHMNGSILDLLMKLLFEYLHSFCHGQAKISFIPDETEIRCEFYHIPKEINEKSIGGCSCSGKEHNTKMLQQIYLDLKRVFTKLILQTHNTSHVQFLVFYLVSLRPGLVTVFLEFLFEQNFKNVNSTRDIRSNSISYLGSLLARAKFINFFQAHSWLEMVCNWCHSYLENQVRYFTFIFISINILFFCC